MIDIPVSRKFICFLMTIGVGLQLAQVGNNSKDLSVKTTTAKIQMMKQGKYVGGYAPYGYILHPTIRNKLAVDPEAAAVIRRMPAIVFAFVQQKHYSRTLKMQKQILLDYEEDITKYAAGLDKGKILSVYRKIPAFLGKDNKKFQISKIARNARNRDYVGTVEWLDNAGIINVCHCLELPELPLKGNYDPDNYKIYYRDTGLLIGSLDEEVQEDLRSNKNFNTYKGAIYENVVADILVKQGYTLYFYRNEKGTLEMNFFVRDADSLIPVEVKAVDGSTPSLNALIGKEKYSDVRYGIKLANRNIGFNGKFYTFPYFLGFLIKRFLRENNHEKVMEKYQENNN